MIRAIDYGKKCIWRPPNLSKLTPIISYMEMTNFGSEAPIYHGNRHKEANIWSYKHAELLLGIYGGHQA